MPEAPYTSNDWRMKQNVVKHLYHTLDTLKNRRTFGDWTPETFEIEEAEVKAALAILTEAKLKLANRPTP